MTQLAIRLVAKPNFALQVFYGYTSAISDFAMSPEWQGLGRKADIDLAQLSKGKIQFRVPKKASNQCIRRSLRAFCGLFA
jgi:hypothetical protein